MLRATGHARMVTSQHDAHVRAAGNSDTSPRSHMHMYNVASRQGARSSSEMQSCWLGNIRIRCYFESNNLENIFNRALIYFDYGA